MWVNIDKLRKSLSEHDEKTGDNRIDANIFVSSFFEQCSFENFKSTAKEDVQRNLSKVNLKLLPEPFGAVLHELTMLGLYREHIKCFLIKQAWIFDYTEIIATLKLCLRMHGVTEQNRERIVVHDIPEFNEFSRKLQDLKSISVLKAIKDNLFIISRALFGDSDKQIKFLDPVKYHLFWDVFTKDILPMLSDHVNKPPKVVDSIALVNLRCDIHFLIFTHLSDVKADEDKKSYMHSNEYRVFDDTLENIYSPESLESLYRMIKAIIQDKKDSYEDFWLSFTKDVVSSTEKFAEQDKQLLTDDEPPAVTLPGNSAIGKLLTVLVPRINATWLSPPSSPEQLDPNAEDSTAAQLSMINKRTHTSSRKRVIIQMLAAAAFYPNTLSMSSFFFSAQLNANTENNSATQPESANKRKAKQSCSDDEESSKKQRLSP